MALPKKCYLCTQEIPNHLKSINMYKAVLFARVSTKKQSFNRQRLDLLPLMYDDGYSDDEIKIIEYKESAIKNDIQSRKSITELVECIDTNSIENVYVTEISRLARRDDVLYKVLAILEERHISLVIQTPQLIRTYEKDGKGNMIKNPIATVLIAFMQHLAVSEMEIKKERAKSGREAKIKEGCITSSQVKFGYDRVDKKPQINTEKAALIIRIYNEYLNGNSVGVIWDNIKHLGLLKVSSSIKYAGARKLYVILTDKTYIGENEHFNYPPLMDRELFFKVQDRLKERADNIKAYKTNNVYYCKGLIYYNGYTLTPSIGDALYTTKNNTNGFMSININVIDWLASVLASKVMAVINIADREKRTNEYIERRVELFKTIEGIESRLKEIEGEIEKNNYMFQKGKRSVEAYEYEDNVIRENIEQLKKEKEDAQRSAADIDALLLSPNETSPREEFSKLIGMKSDNEIYDNVHRCVERIELTKVDKKTINIHFIFKFNSYPMKYYYQYVKNNSHIELYKMDIETNKKLMNLSDLWDKRIIRHSNKTHKKN